MSAMANTTPIVTTVTKPATNPGREKTSRDADATPRVNIQDFFEEYYDDILPIIMDKIRRDKRKKVYARLDFGEGPSERRIREGRAHSTDLAKLTRQAQPSADRIGEALGIVLAEEAALSGGTLLMEIVLRVETALAASGNHMITLTPPTGQDQPRRYRDRDRSRHVKRGRDSESLLSRVDPFTPRIRNFKSSRKTRMPNNVKTYDGTGDPEDHVKNFQAATQLQGSQGSLLSIFHAAKEVRQNPVKIYNIKQKDGETIEDFMERFKVETGRMKGAPECMRIFGFMHGVNNLELTKRLNENVLKIMEEMMITTTVFIRGEAAAAGKKKGNTSWRTHDQSKRHILEKRSDFRAEAEKFQPPPHMVTPVEKRSNNKSYDFHNDKGHSTDECMQLKKKIEELVRAGKLSHLIKEIKQGRDQSKKVTQSFKRVREITFPSLTTSSGTEGPLVIEAKIGGHMIHRILLVTIGDADHSTRAWMNFMIVRSLSPYNGIIRRLRIKEIQAVPSTAHEMLKFPADGEIVTIRNTILIPAECATVITSSKEIPKEARPSDMTGVPRSVAEHRLNIREGYSPIRQKKRGQASERAKAIQAEVQKLVEAGIMREVYYHDWLSNPVMVKKHDAHEMLKFSADREIVTIRSTILIPAECATVITSSKEIPKEARIRHENFKVALHPNFPDQEVATGGTLSAKGRTELCSLLKENLDIFAW
nr:hypothetical protein [Tanacetum cinerariifolium]